MLDKLWDDVVAGPQPERGLGRLRRGNYPTKPIAINIIGLDVDQGGSSSGPSTPTTPATPSTPTTPFTARKDQNVWRSVFHPGSNSATKTIGGDYFDNTKPNSPTVYDWLYSGDTRSNHR